MNRPRSIVPAPSTAALLSAFTRRTGRLVRPAALAAAATVAVPTAHAANRTWIGGNTVWTDGGSVLNWSPADEPDPDDTAIFNTANAVDLGSNNSIEALTLSGGIDLFTQTFTLTTDLDTTLSGSSTNLNLGGNDLAGLGIFSGLSTENVSIGAGSRINIGGNRLLSQATSGNAIIGNDGDIFGNGLIQNNDSSASTFTMLRNDGTIGVSNYNEGFVIIGGVPAARTLQINSFDADARVDLDGTFGAGTVDVFRNQTLDNNVQLSDGFGGSINLFHNSTLDMEDAWTLDFGTITVDNGFVAGTIFSPDIPADQAFIDGGTLTQTGGTIVVTDADGELVFDAPFVGNGGELDVSSGGTVRFNANSSFNNGFTWNGGGNGTGIVDNNAILTVNDDTFNMDGSGGADWTIRNGAIMRIRGDVLDSTGGAAGNDEFNGTLTFEDDDNSTITGGDQILDINVADNLAQLNRVIVNSGTARITSNANDNIQLQGLISVNGTSRLVLDSNFIEFNEGGTVTGTGLLFFDETVSIDDDTTITIGTLDIDNVNGSLTIDPGATLDLNATNINTIGTNATFLINGGTAEVSTANYNFGNTGQLAFIEFGAGAVNPVYQGDGTVRFLSGSSVTNTSDGALLDSDAIFDEGSSIINQASAARLTIGQFGETVTFDGGDISETFAGSTVTTGGTWLVTGASTVDVTTFDWDQGVTRIASGGNLTIVADTVDLGNDVHNNLIDFTGGALNVNTVSNTWTTDFTLRSTSGGSISGDRLLVGNDGGALSADVEIDGGLLTISAVTDYNADADVEIAGGATLRHTGTTNFNSRNGLIDAEYTGAGTLQLAGTNNFNEVTVINMIGGTVDLDNSFLFSFFANDTNVNASTTINAATFQPYGSTKTGIGTTFSEINIADTAVFTVNIDDNSPWRVLSNGIINYNGNTVLSNFLAGDTLDLDGTLNVNGDGQILSSIAIGGTVNINDIGERFQLAAPTNTIDGGTVNGPGLFTAGLGDDLIGDGTINANVDFEGSGFIQAEGGLLDMNGTVLDVGTLRTNGGAAVFDLANALNTNVTDTGLILNGGRFQGATITVSAGDLISGLGRVLNNVNNNGFLRANGGTLRFESFSNDYDGSGENGTLQAFSGTLILEDNFNQSFSGTATASNGTISAEGFALNMDSNSQLNFNGNSSFIGTNATSFAGEINVGGGETGTIGLGGLQATVGSTANGTINGEVIFNTTSRFLSGANFTGTGAIVNFTNELMQLDGGVDLGVTLTNDGDLELGGGNASVTASVANYDGDGVLNIDIDGLGLNESDTLDVDGILSLQEAGDELAVSFNGFAPVLGNLFTIATASSVLGQFDTVSVTGLGAALDVDVIYNPLSVVLEIVAASAGIIGDYNDSGQVEQGDLNLVLNNWGAPAPFTPNGPAFATLNVDQEELNRVLNNWGNTSPPPVFDGFAVPEPGAAAVGLALAGLALRRRRVA
ncbi:MAG: hypothetical protein AAGE65_12825 [Planctomycetota bacterium]